MAYQDDERPEKRGEIFPLFFVLGAVLAFAGLTVVGMVSYAGSSRVVLLLLALFLAVCMLMVAGLVRRRRQMLRHDDEFHQTRFNWSRSHGLLAGIYILAALTLFLRFLKFMPAEWGRAVTTFLPHVDAFADGVTFAFLTIAVCVVAAGWIWQLRHK